MWNIEKVHCFWCCSS